MTTKEWLNRAYKVDEQVKIYENEKKDLLTYATRCTAGVGDNSKKTFGNGSESKFTSYADSVARYEKILNREIEKLIKTKSEVTEAISKINNPDYRELLMLRYIEFMKWEDIANFMHFEHEYVRGALHQKALKSVESFIEN